VWLAAAKSRPYNAAVVDTFVAASEEVARTIRSTNGKPGWVPPLHQIEKWWDDATLRALGHAMAKIKAMQATVPTDAFDLLRVAFCWTMMDHANVSFGHQSMSFKRREPSKRRQPVFPGFSENPIVETWDYAVSLIASAARKPTARFPRVILLDSRKLDSALPTDHYACVITSPPYPNRMSYIRELRPYMYWLGFLAGGRAAGELDWQAIGGTWGCATSNLNKWQPPPDTIIPYAECCTILSRIAQRSDILARYVHKYFVDMLQHCACLFRVVRPGGSIHYIVGNSKFYDVVLPVEEIYAAMFETAGFSSVAVETSRKRTSKKELFEFVVSARKPAPSMWSDKPVGRGQGRTNG
jgi:hypothetical protein